MFLASIIRNPFINPTTRSIMRFIYLTLFAAVMAFASCENETAYEVPVLADEFMTFSIDGQEITLNAISGSTGYANDLEINDSDNPGINRLRLERASRDLSTRMTITARDLPLTKNGDDFSFNYPGYVPATIAVRSNYMSGSIYCPHVEGLESVTYEGLIRIEELTKEGTVKGRFMTDNDATDNAARIDNGNFVLGVTMN